MSSGVAGHVLRARRLALGLRQADLAAMAGISPSYLNLIEHDRRRAGPDVRAALARALGVDPAALAEGADTRLAEDLRSAAALVAGAPVQGTPLGAEGDTPPPELDRLDDFIGRFPGWAGAVAALGGRVRGLERLVEALNDRLGHDPHLSAALHEVLQVVASVRSTAAILAETDDITPEWQGRFHQNLHQDSERLATGAEALVAYLDGAAGGGEPMPVSPQDEVEHWLDRRGWHLPEVEDAPDAATALARLAPEWGGLASQAAREMARAHVMQAHADALRFPGRVLAQSVARHGPDPLALLALSGAGGAGALVAAFRRLATRPNAPEGLVICDASGTLTFRKGISGFPLPRFGAACPLWPLFAALTRPGQPIETRVMVAGPTGRPFLLRALAEVEVPGGFSGPALVRSAMLIAPTATAGAGQGSGLATVGSSCRICPEPACAARREPSILQAGQGRESAL